MCRVNIEGKGVDVNLDVNPSADFIGCLLTGVMAALPAFLEAFMRCLGGGTGSGDYNPGTRDRCGTGQHPEAPATDAPTDK